MMIDCEPGKFTMDCEKPEDAITEKDKNDYPRGSLRDSLRDYDRIGEIVERKRRLFRPSDNRIQQAVGRIVVMADAAHSFGAAYKAEGLREVLADFTCFSFHAVKI